jgi:SeqA-like protein
MKAIEIDEDVFNFLTSNATPFVDTPNSVLRRLLSLDIIDDAVTIVKNNYERKDNKLRTNEFVDKFLSEKFKNEYFHRKDRFQYMFESNKKIIYFQNFNQSNSNLWYRVTDKPWGILNTTSKDAYLCLTNPEEGIAYLFPVDDIANQIKKTGWSRNYLEINIDYSYHRWREFKWNIKEYLINK